MAKVPFTKLKCKINTDEIPVQIGEETITVKQYLPIQEKLELITKVILQSHEQDENYSNPVKIKVFTMLEILFAYTNISFTDKQKEDLPKLYDLLESSKVLNIILKAIPVEELESLYAGIKDSVEAIYKYQNSILGILDTIKTDYGQTEFDITKITEMLQNEDLGMIRDIVSKLG